MFCIPQKLKWSGACKDKFHIWNQPYDFLFKFPIIQMSYEIIKLIFSLWSILCEYLMKVNPTYTFSYFVS